MTIILSLLALAADPVDRAAVTQESVPIATYVDLENRVMLESGQPMQVTCLGEGGPTAVLIAGSGGWSEKWAALHDDLAAITRSCTIDRPGYGMAGVGRGPRSPDMVEDYREAMALAGETGPFIIVGHSLGGEEGVFWADRYPEEIAGLVLVDPGMPDFAKKMATHAPTAFQEMRGMMMGAVGYYSMCAEQVEALHGGNMEVEISRCLPRGEPAVVEALSPVALDPARLRFNAEAIEYFTNPESETGTYSGDIGDIPTLVLQATVRTAPPGLSDEAKAQSPLVDAQMVAHHDALVSYSTRAELRPVPEAGHDIIADRPDAIVSGLADIVAMVRGEAD